MPFAAVGRMALTDSLIQSGVGTLFFIITQRDCMDGFDRLGRWYRR
jgi:uncharacterized membrane protein YeiB